MEVEDQLADTKLSKELENEQRAEEIKQVIDELDSLQKEFDLEGFQKKSEVACADLDQQIEFEQEERNDFQILDNPLFEMGAKSIYDNPLLVMEDETSSKVSKHEIECGFQLMDDMRSNHENMSKLVIGNLPWLLDNECISGVEGEVSTWKVLDHGYFNIFDIEVLTKHGLIAAGNFIIAARKRDFRLVTYETLKKEGPKHNIYKFDDPSLGLSDALSYTNYFWGLGLKTTIVPCSIVDDAFMDGLQEITK